MRFLILKLNHLGAKQKLAILILNDVLSALVCWIVFGPPLATYISSEFTNGLMNIFFTQWKTFFFPILFSLFFLYLFGFYKSLIKFFDSKDSILLSIVGSLIFGISWSFFYINQFQIISTTFLAIMFLQGLLLSAVFYAFINITRDIAKYFLYPANINKDAKNIVIYGAGTSGNELFQSILLDPSKRLLAFFDDSINLKDRKIHNIPIIGKFSQLEEFKTKYPDLEVLLAVPSLQTEKRRKIIEKLESIKVAVRTVPSFNELIADQKKMTDIQNLSLDDLLPRARVKNDSLRGIKSKTLFVSGAGGSIGSEIVRQLLDNKAHKIILFDLSEFNLFSIERECKALKQSKNIDTEVIPILGDIRDYANLEFLFKKYNIDGVYHAAAYKHVPIVEDVNNITKASENNIIGTFNLAKISKENNVESFVMISTDKAVRPSNIMGASKRMAEMVIQSLNTQTSNTKFSMVRFGNVINSSGSVIPLFLDQIAKGGPVTVTSKNVTRYFMTIPEASNLVLQAADMSEGGEVFILDMGEQLKIYDLARKLIHLSGRSISADDSSDGIKIVEIGLRPGEKMYEELLISGNQIPTSNSKIFKSVESFPSVEVIDGIMTRLKTAIKQNDFKTIISIFKENVEGYIYDER
jgi:FlaA1/EpsC-like NDP-sugar epimerase